MLQLLDGLCQLSEYGDFDIVCAQHRPYADHVTLRQQSCNANAVENRIWRGVYGETVPKLKEITLVISSEWVGGIAELHQ